VASVLASTVYFPAKVVFASAGAGAASPIWQLRAMRNPRTRFGPPRWKGTTWWRRT
jgi:hypothetical protein